MSRLSHLKLFGNRLSGTIPTELSPIMRARPVQFNDDEPIDDFRRYDMYLHGAVSGEAGANAGGPMQVTRCWLTTSQCLASGVGGDRASPQEYCGLVNANRFIRPATERTDKCFVNLSVAPSLAIDASPHDIYRTDANMVLLSGAALFVVRMAMLKAKRNRLPNLN